MYSDEDVFIKDIFDVTIKRGKTAEYLIQNFDWSFLMVVFTSIDRIQHVMWKYLDQKHPQYDSKKAKRYYEYIKYYWRRLDAIIGKLIKKVGEETTIIIVSDHGFGPRNQTFYVNEWLRKRGYLKLKNAKRKSTLTKLVEYLYERFGNTMFYHYFIGLLQKLISRKFIYRFFYQFWSHEGLINKIDWENTKAFSCLHTSIFGNIYVNLEGREPEGTVRKENYEDVRNHIIDDLKKLIDPNTRKQMSVKVYKREEIYYGPYTDQAPDIIFSINDGECESDVRFGHTTTIRQGSDDIRQSGTHRSKGVFIARGSNIKQGHKIKGAKIIDITPTLLHLFDIPIPKSMDGRVLKDIFKQESSPGKKKIIFSEISSLQEKQDNDKLTKENEDLIIKRLRNLGYI
jgi:predicted AlkP superfamily phosphohydrolase/phosphomutase